MDVAICKCGSLNVSYDANTGSIHCRDCHENTGYNERQKMDFSEHAREERDRELDVIRKEMEAGVEYDVDNQTFINVTKKQDLN